MADKAHTKWLTKRQAAPVMCLMYCLAFRQMPSVLSR